jgi:hypothetical protein
MRLAVLVLLLANVAFLAWARYAPEQGTIEPQLVAQQMRPDTIKLLSAQQVAALASKKRETAKVATCLEWGAFNTADLARARSALEPLAGSARVSERQVEDSAGWWVFMPSQGSRAAAIQKVGELKRLGVEEYFVVQDDPKFRFAISLGIFRTEDAARVRLEQLRARGVRTANIGARPSPVQRSFLQVRDFPEGLAPKLIELRESFPGVEVKDCAER